MTESVWKSVLRVSDAVLEHELRQRGYDVDLDLHELIIVDKEGK